MLSAPQTTLPRILSLSIQPLLIQETLPYTADSSHWLARVRDLGQPVWLDSARPFSQRGRYDIISAAPLQVIQADNQGARDPFESVKDALQQQFTAAVPPCDWPFSGGAIGLFGYELGRQLERMPARLNTAPAFPDLLVGLYSWAIVSDHVRCRTALLIRPETPSQLIAELQRRTRGSFAEPESSFALDSLWSEEFPSAQYQTAFQQLQAYIQAGDCYQVNLARRFANSYRGDPWRAYQHLREHCCGTVLRLPRISGRRNRPMPIAGTFPGRRSRSVIYSTDQRYCCRAAMPMPLIDRQLAEQLRNNEKNRAENLMIVDLLRNDLGRSCIPGSIAVEAVCSSCKASPPFIIWSAVFAANYAPIYSHSTRYGNCFPGGSISGAPKVRAMQIIDELEPQARARCSAAPSATSAPMAAWIPISPSALLLASAGKDLCVGRRRHRRGLRTAAEELARNTQQNRAAVAGFSHGDLKIHTVAAALHNNYAKSLSR